MHFIISMLFRWCCWPLIQTLVMYSMDEILKIVCQASFLIRSITSSLSLKILNFSIQILSQNTSPYSILMHLSIFAIHISLLLIQLHVSLSLFSLFSMQPHLFGIQNFNAQTYKVKYFRTEGVSHEMICICENALRLWKIYMNPSLESWEEETMNLTHVTLLATKLRLKEEEMRGGADPN